MLSDCSVFEAVLVKLFLVPFCKKILLLKNSIFTESSFTLITAIANYDT